LEKALATQIKGDDLKERGECDHLVAPPPRLWDNGTDIVFVEKQSTVTLMSPYAEPVGISIIDSEGFGSCIDRIATLSQLY
jgi:hypothetical protein